MKEKQEQYRINKIKDILPILWNSYEHMYEARENNAISSINFLMIVATFLPIFCLMLYTTFKSPFFLIPILFQIAALLILLKRFFIKVQIPWLKLNETLERLNHNSFEVDLLSTLKAAESSTYKRLRALRKLINSSLLLLVFSILLTALASLFLIFEGSFSLYIATGVLVLIFLFLSLFYLRVPKFQFESEESSNKSAIDEWIKSRAG